MVPVRPPIGVAADQESLEAPPGFGVRQFSGALAMEASQPKAPEDWRSPRRYRAIHRFTVPMHAQKRQRIVHKPIRRRLATCHGKAALKTHALQTLREGPVSPNLAKRLECVRFIGASCRTRDSPRFRDPMYANMREENFHERVHSTPRVVRGRNDLDRTSHGDAGAFCIQESPSSAALSKVARLGYRAASTINRVRHGLPTGVG